MANNNNKMIKVAASCLLIVAVVLLVSFPSSADLSCGVVTKNLIQCVTYLTGSGAGSDPSPACCDGVKNLKNMANTPDDRKAACACLKQSAQSMSNINLSKASSLPGKCGVNIGYSVSPNIDCSRVS